MIRRTLAVLAFACASAGRLFAQCPGTAAAPQSPSGNIAANTAVTFNWTLSPTSGVTGYDVYVQHDNGGLTAVCSAANTATSCTFANGFNAGGGYVWLVRTKFSSCNLDSTLKAFTVGCTTTAPNAQFPVSGATNVSTTPTLQWSNVAGANSYDIFFGVANTAGAGCSGQPVATSNSSSFNPPQLQPGTTYEWKVQAKFTNGCPGTSSSCSTFTTAGSACSPAGAFSPVSPANNAAVTTDKPTLQWSPSAGADKYFIHIGLNNPPLPQVSDPLVSASSTSYTVNQSLANGTYYWYVDAIPACGTTGKTSSPVFKFTVTSCPTAAPALVSPANNATNVANPVTFQWAAVSNATGYQLYVNDTLVTTTTDTSASAIVPADSTATWYVAALYRDCKAVNSVKFSFKSAAPAMCPAGSIALLAPANNATLSGDNKVAFSWSAINGASAYRLFVSMDGGAPAQLARTTDPTALIALPNGVADWYVEALFPSIATTDCPSIVSPHGKFTVAKAANCGTHTAVTLVSPTSGNATSPVDFTWNIADNSATLYRLWVSVNGQAFDDLGVTTASHLKVAVGAGTVTWFVQSFFEGCPSMNSANASFTLISTTPRCPTTAPTPLAPGNNATLISPVTFTWTAVAGTNGYRLLVSKDGGDFTLLGDDLDATSVTRNLPPGSYTWFVEATFDECPTTKSTRSKFTVNQVQNCGQNVVPQLLVPADGASPVQSPVTFDWSDTPTAVGYIVLIKHNDGSPTRLDETATSETTKHLAPGTYEWWVLALFNGCPPTESAHFHFVVPDNPCGNKRPLLLLPPDHSTLLSPAHFAWTPAGSGLTYRVWASVDGGPFNVLGTTTATTLDSPVPAGKVRWFVETLGAALACSPTTSSINVFTVLTSLPCATPGRPVATVIGQVASGTPYSVRWTPIPNTVHYQLQESATADFANATTQVVTSTSAEFTHTVSAVTRFHYRVRAVSSCSDDHSAYSRVVTVFVLPGQRGTSVELGLTAKTTQSVKLPGHTPATTFSAQMDKPWATVSPSSGNIDANGVTLTITYDPAALPLGTNTATLLVTYGASGKKGSNVTSTGVPVSISLVTPVAPTGKNTPIPESLIIPAVAHAQGANSSMFQSDVRIANVSATIQKYLLNFTLSGTDGTQSGQSTTIQIDPGAQLALDDILTSFFGNGADGSGAAGMLEIRPLTSSTTSTSSPSGIPSIQTVASSKTYNVTSNGTFGQYIPAIPFAQFIAKATSGANPIISLQQIAQSASYRTNFGLVEGAGEAADVLVHVFDNAGHELAQIPISLLPGEHKQINSFLAVNNLTISDGRIEVEVVSSTGKVSAYASVVDNLTNDPLLVFPVLKGGATSNRYTIPGVADLNNGFASWRSDLRLFNPGTSPIDATLNYYPQGNVAGPAPQIITIKPGEVRAIDNALQSLYGITNSGGAIVVSTPSTSALTVTARTYNQTSAGTYGQFIPAISPAQSVGLGDRTLQILQLESSSAFRTNLGLNETSGSPVTIELTILPADSKVSAKLQMDLAPNEFRQISLADFGFGTIYNTRVSVKVIGGTGKVTAYGSVIDQITQDPTYVLAQ